MNTLRIGLVGCGRVIQKVHLRALQALQGAQVTALADPDPDRRRQASRRVPDAATYADHEELLAHADVEAVIVSAPPFLHARIAQAALQAGKHVYLEKPGALSSDEVEAIVRAWRRSGCVAVVGLNFRFHPLYAALRDNVQAGKVDDVVAARSVFCAAARALPEWKRARRSGGGVLLDLAVHHVDITRFIFGQEVEEVTARTRSVRSEDDTAAVDLRLAGGPVVQSLVSMSAIERDQFEVYGTSGHLAMDRYGSGQLAFTPTRRPRSRVERVRAGLGALADTPRRILQTVIPPSDPSHQASLQSFADAARQGDPTAVRRLDDAFRTLAVVFAAEASAQSGQSEVPKYPNLIEAASLP